MIIAQLHICPPNRFIVRVHHIPLRLPLRRRVDGIARGLEATRGQRRGDVPGVPRNGRAVRLLRVACGGLIVGGWGGGVGGVRRLEWDGVGRWGLRCAALVPKEEISAYHQRGEQEHHGPGRSGDHADPRPVRRRRRRRGLRTPRLQRQPGPGLPAAGGGRAARRDDRTRLRVRAPRDRVVGAGTPVGRGDAAGQLGEVRLAADARVVEAAGARDLVGGGGLAGRAARRVGGREGRVRGARRGERGHDGRRGPERALGGEAPGAGDAGGESGDVPRGRGGAETRVVVVVGAAQARDGGADAAAAERGPQGLGPVRAAVGDGRRGGDPVGGHAAGLRRHARREEGPVRGRHARAEVVGVRRAAGQAEGGGGAERAGGGVGERAGAEELGVRGSLRHGGRAAVVIVLVMSSRHVVRIMYIPSWGWIGKAARCGVGSITRRWEFFVRSFARSARLSVPRSQIQNTQSPAIRVESASFEISDEFGPLVS
ncbi:hypothetical protein FGG08_006455 [Glutinoglossum americanum]|uniref:Uncharacterized protein n=1 Tax=Glutinoglossum americanum TaxID=1670608 RepID=A0A9P8I1H4_9PEZI|nr:hypothetical protein FGG08_006455 [Glutinoglossum americanum]